MNMLNQRLQRTIQDRRYTIAKEFTGKEDPQFVIRFCGSFVSADPTENEAILSAIIHQGERGLRLLC
jgi:hypothetical protein